MQVDQMSPVDAYFYYSEQNGVNRMHMGGFALVEGIAPTQGEISGLVAAKLHLVPRYRHIARVIPLHLGRPVWVDDLAFDIDNHVRRTELPEPGGDSEMRSVIERVMSSPLDRRRPLWELWIIDGLETQHWVVLWKIHHCMADGVSGSELLTVLFGDPPTDGESSSVEPWLPTSPPTPTQLAAAAVVDLMKLPSQYVRAATGALASLRSLRKPIAASLAAAGRTARPNPVSNLNGSIGTDRRYAFSSRSLDAFKEIRAAFGGTINDVVLAAVTRGFRDLLLSRHEPVSEVVIRTVVPVATRQRSETGLAIGDGTYTNKAVAIVAELPVGLSNPVERIHAVTRQMQELKQSGQAEGARTLIEWSDLAPGSLIALGSRVSGFVRQSSVNTTVTNVPGPQSPLYLLGRRLLSMYALAPLFPIGARITTAVYSYDGVLHFGITGAYEATDDMDVFDAGIHRGIDELLGCT